MWIYLLYCRKDQDFSGELAKLSLLLLISGIHNFPAFKTLCCLFIKPVHFWWFHLSLLTLCLCGLVSPPVLPFIIPLVCSCVTPSFHSLSPTLKFFRFSFLYFFPLLFSSSLSLSCLSPSLLPPCSVRDKFVEVDLKPVCKHCYERLPDDMKRRLAKRERDSKEKKKKLIPMCLWSSLSPFSSFALFFLWSVSIFLLLCLDLFLFRVIIFHTRCMSFLFLISLSEWVHPAFRSRDYVGEHTLTGHIEVA